MIDRQLFDQLAAEGWGGLEGFGERAKKDAELAFAREREAAERVAKPFLTQDGRHCLFELFKGTVLRPPSEHEAAAKTVEEFALLKARRDGQNEMFFAILRAIRTARGEQPNGEGSP